MRPSSLLPRLQDVQSPCLDVLSPPIDAGDASSDDGDTLQTPLTEHDEHRPHSYGVYNQHRHHITQDPFHSYGPAERADDFVDTAKLNFTSAAAYSLLSPPLPSSVSENHHGALFSTPTRALDLANASLEINQFSGFSNYSLDPSASPFTPTNQSLETASPLFAPSPEPKISSPLGAHLPSLPSLCLDNLCGSDDAPSLLLSPDNVPSTSELEDLRMMQGRIYSPRFHNDHTLNPFFVRSYLLGDELGAGGYGFVMTARHRTEGHEVAVKFIIKDKVPEHAWWEDDMFGKVPTEVMLLSLVNHENVVKCLDLYEDEVYFYLVQELHGSPWESRKKKKSKQITAPGKLVVPTPSATPLLTPSPSVESTLDSVLHTPPQACIDNDDNFPSGSQEHSLCEPSSFASDTPDMDMLAPLEIPQIFLKPPPVAEPRPNFSRRASHDLFECIEQSKHKRLSENQARYVFAQVVEAVYYLDTQGITHCDIKDENLVIDSDLKVKLIDFGSAVVADPSTPRPYYTLFFGTTAYASSEILLKKPYRAPPAEIWTLGVLLSYLLTGHSPFPTEQDAKDGRVIVREPRSGRLSRAAVALMARCLEKDPERRADIMEVRGHRWLHGALERGGYE